MQLPEHYETLANMMAGSAWGYGMDKHMEKAQDYLNKSLGNHDEGNHKAAHSDMLVANSHFKAHLLAVNHPDAHLLSGAAEATANGYKHAYEV